MYSVSLVLAALRSTCSWLWRERLGMLVFGWRLVFEWRLLKDLYSSCWTEGQCAITAAATAREAAAMPIAIATASIAYRLTDCAASSVEQG